MKEYKIDYELFSALEIIKIMEFFNLIVQTKTKSIDKKNLIEKYNEYRNILNNKTLEKQYDKMLFQAERVSIYKVVKSYNEKSWGIWFSSIFAYSDVSRILK